MLKDLSLTALSETRLQELFVESLETVEESFEKGPDLAGKRSITITLSFEQKKSGYVEVDMCCTTSTPKRKVCTFASIDEGTLKIDTVSNDAKQPDLLDTGNIIKFPNAVEGGR